MPNLIVETKTNKGYCYSLKKGKLDEDHVKILTKNKIANPNKHIFFKSDMAPNVEPSTQKTVTEIKDLNGFELDGTGGKDEIDLKNCKNASIFGAGSKDKLVLSDSKNIKFYGNWNSQKHYDFASPVHNFFGKILGKSKPTDEVVKDNKSTCNIIN